MRYLLDADTCIAAMRGHSVVLQHLTATMPGDCAISTITRYELWVGVEKSANPVKEKAKIDLLVRTCRQLRFGIAAPYARLKSARFLKVAVFRSAPMTHCWLGTHCRNH
jgi:predicted nucleic acid-binding protein